MQTVAEPLFNAVSWQTWSARKQPDPGIVTVDISSAFVGKKVMVTGHTGFKGAWLSLWLSELGADVHGFGLPPAHDDAIYSNVKDVAFVGMTSGDIRDFEAVNVAIGGCGPDYVFHLAAQPLVRLSYADPLGTLATNVQGSANVLEAVRHLPKTCHTVFVTSDKCYRNCEWTYAYRENDALGGKDPYSMSKAAAELVAESWRRSYFDHHPHGSRVLSVRAGNVIGGGDYSADRLVPDCVRAAVSDRPLIIRSPGATRPWQHVLDCLHGYLTVAARLPTLAARADAETFNFGPEDSHAHPVAEVAETFFKAWDRKTKGVVYEPADNALAEAVSLSVAIDKSKFLLGWRPVWSFMTAMQQTVAWYSEKHLRNGDMTAFSREQIRLFTEAARRLGNDAWK